MTDAFVLGGVRRGFDHNRIWCAIVELAMELTAWLRTALRDHPLPQRQERYQIFSPAALGTHRRRVQASGCPSRQRRH
jgi:hypothetical protein